VSEQVGAVEGGGVGRGDDGDEDSKAKGAAQLVGPSPQAMATSSAGNVAVGDRTDVTRPSAVSIARAGAS
jgi:hypothetical protein